MNAPVVDRPDEGRTAGANFSLHDSNVLKGIAILAIALHNYFHRVPNIVGENEFDFDRARFAVFLDQLSMPWTTVQALFSFFGHYGVGIFVTLSCYGLAMSRRDAGDPGVFGFLAARVRKLLPMILLCVGLWLILQLRSRPPSDTGYWSSILVEVALLCTGLFTIVPGLPLPAVGPWWFIPFILQFYLLWALAGRRLLALPTSALLVLAVAIHGAAHLVNPITLSSYQINLLETPIGHFPEIALGILLLRFKPVDHGLWVAPLVALLVIGNWSALLWPATPVAATLILLIVYDRLRPRFPATRFLAWVGLLSLPIFLLNGYIRRPFLALSQASGIVGADLVLGLVAVASSIMLAALLTYLLERAGSLYAKLAPRAP